MASRIDVGDDADVSTMQRPGVKTSDTTSAQPETLAGLPVEAARRRLAREFADAVCRAVEGRDSTG